MNFASPFSYVETNEEEEAGVEVLDDSDLEEGVMGENMEALTPLMSDLDIGEGRQQQQQMQQRSGRREETKDREEAAPSGGIVGSIRSGMARLFGQRAASRATPAPPGARAAPGAPPRAPPQQQSRRRRNKKKKKKKFRQRIDTNVVSLSLGNLADEASVATGDATQCSKCKAVLSVLSTLTDHTGAVIASPTDAEAAEATAADTADTTATPVEEERQLRTVPEEDAEPAQDTPTTTATTTATATTNEAADAVVPPPAAAAAASAAAAAAAAAADTPAEEEARQVRTTPHDAEGPAETPVADRTSQAAPELSATAAAAAPAARSTVVAASTGAAAAESSGTGAGAGAGAGEGAGEGAGAGAGAGAGVGAGAGAGAGSGSSDTTSPPTVEEGDQLWTCEFCGTHNVVTLDNEEIPTQGCLDYIVEPAPAAMSKSESESIIVFCIDVSGSMCVSQPVQGNFKLRGDRTAELSAELRAFAEGPQDLGGARGVTYVSRLQAVQAAVTSQLETLAEAFPKRRVALVTFSSDVTIIGDGSGEPKTLAGTRLNDFNQMLEAGREVHLTSTIKETAASLTSKVYGLSEGGATALGPAVVAAVGVASNAPGSRVIVCTDGLANVGMGALDEVKTDEERAAVDAFYKRVGTYAVDKGVAVDVIGIQGEGCDVETLTAMVETSGGEIDKVNPLELHKNFGTALTNPVIATKVCATVILHAGLQFRAAEGVLGNRMVRDLGNATRETEVTFEYSNKTAAQLRAAGINLASLKRLPFQVQIEYTKLNGMKCLRVISKAQAITHDLRQAEQRADTAVLATHAQQTSAALASAGDYDGSRANAMMWGRMLKRTAVSNEQQESYTRWARDATELELALREQQEAETMDAAFAMASSDDDDDTDGGERSKERTVRRTQRSKMRRAARSNNDYLSSVIHKNKKRATPRMRRG